MSPIPYPYAVRLFGFDRREITRIELAFAKPRGKGCGYFILDEDNLQDPDLYLVKGDDPRALANLAARHPSILRPALLIGTPATPLPYKTIAGRIESATLVAALDELVEQRADALARLEASDVVLVPERRRRDRAIQPADPAVFERMRVRRPEKGMVLVVDRTPALYEYLREQLARSRRRVACVDDEAGAIRLCGEHPAALVLVNTSVPGLDPYRLCRSLKQAGAPAHPAVVLLIGKTFTYDTLLARHAGVEGYLRKPLESRHVASLLKKFLPEVR